MKVKIYGIHLVDSSEDRNFKQRDAKRRGVKKNLSKGLCTWSLKCGKPIYKFNLCRNHNRKRREYQKKYEEELRKKAKRESKQDYQNRLNALEVKPFLNKLKKLRDKCRKSLGSHRDKRRKANSLSILKWNWLYKNPDKNTGGFIKTHPEYPKNLENDCAWCDITKSCNQCALNDGGKEGCAGGFYDRYLDARDQKIKKECAGKILEMLKYWERNWEWKHQKATPTLLEDGLREEKKLAKKGLITFRRGTKNKKEKRAIISQKNREKNRCVCCKRIKNHQWLIWKKYRGFCKDCVSKLSFIYFKRMKLIEDRIWKSNQMDLIRDYYQCELCEYKSESPEQMVRHFNKNHPEHLERFMSDKIAKWNTNEDPNEDKLTKPEVQERFSDEFHMRLNKHQRFTNNKLLIEMAILDLYDERNQREIERCFEGMIQVMLAKKYIALIGKEKIKRGRSVRVFQALIGFDMVAKYLPQRTES